MSNIVKTVTDDRQRFCTFSHK